MSVPEPKFDIVEKDGIGAPEEVAAEATQDAFVGEETEAGAEESPEVFDEAVESVVEESETTFEETEANFQEVEPSFGEAERTFGEAETAFAPPQPEFVETVVEPPEPTPVAAPLFGKRDPMEKAQRLARVLVSDIILYNPDRHYD
ncbi:MAG: hypothetical protein MUO50_15125, partial [Longimicrobiales bacterium]|nr:hypothetical protein [Longimicrobiales bacterium]